MYQGRVSVGGKRPESPESSRAAAAEVDDVEDEFVGDEAPRLDSLLQEGEVDEAKLPVRFNLNGEHRSDGGELGKLRRRWSDSGREEIAPIQEMREGEWGSRWRRSGGLLNPMGPWHGAAQVRRWRHGAGHCGHSEVGDEVLR